MKMTSLQASLLLIVLLAAVVSGSPAFVVQKQKQPQPAFVSELSYCASAATFPTAATVEEPENLYQILGASQSDSKAQLKKHYLTLAKQTHPDALISAVKQHNDKETTVSAVNFSSVANAWNILGDDKLRLQYDRDLNAQHFCDAIAATANLCVDLLEGFASFVFNRYNDHQQQQAQQCRQEHRQEMWFASK